MINYSKQIKEVENVIKSIRFEMEDNYDPCTYDILYRAKDKALKLLYSLKYLNEL